jgi:hypothetical protein
MSVNNDKLMNMNIIMLVEYTFFVFVVCYFAFFISSCFGDYGFKCEPGYHDRFSYFHQLLQIGTRKVPEVRPRPLSTAVQVRYSHCLYDSTLEI